MKRKISAYIQEQKKKGYPDDIPDEAPERLEQLGKVPSYRRIAFAILKQDHNLLTLGKSPAYSLAYDLLKQKELKERAKKRH